MSPTVSYFSFDSDIVMITISSYCVLYILQCLFYMDFIHYLFGKVKKSLLTGIGVFFKNSIKPSFSFTFLINFPSSQYNQIIFILMSCFHSLVGIQSIILICKCIGGVENKKHLKSKIFFLSAFQKLSFVPNQINLSKNSCECVLVLCECCDFSFHFTVCFSCNINHNCCIVSYFLRS